MKPSNIILLGAFAFYAVAGFLVLGPTYFPEIRLLTGGDFQVLSSFASTYTPKNAFFTIVLVFLGILATLFVIAGPLLAREYFNSKNRNYENDQQTGLIKKVFRLYVFYCVIVASTVIAYSQGVDLKAFF